MSPNYEQLLQWIEILKSPPISSIISSMILLYIALNKLKFELNFKRKFFLKVLTKCDSVKSVIDELYEVLYPNKLTKLSILAAYIYFIIGVFVYVFGIKNAESLKVLSEIPNRIVEYLPRMLNLVLLNTVVCLGVSVISIMAFVIDYLVRYPQRINYILHRIILILNRLYLSAVFVTAYLTFLVGYYLPRESNIVFVFMFFLILHSLAYVGNWLILRSLTDSIKKHIQRKLLEDFRNKAPYIVIFTKSQIFKGILWDFFDKDFLQLKRRNVVYIPWNEISSIEVVDSSDNIVHVTEK